MQQQVVVTYTISQSEILVSLDIWVKKTPSVKIVCTHTQKFRFSLYFRKNITCLSAGLLMICQAFFLAPLKLSRWVTTNCPFMITSIDKCSQTPVNICIAMRCFL